MNRNHMLAWRDYLGDEMHDRLGIELHEAKKRVTNWLRSLGRVNGLRPPSEASHIRRQRAPLSRNMRTSSATRSHSVAS
jgi:hypothetical protein